MRTVRARRAVAVGDQALSSLSNVAITVLAARALPPEDFGSFAVAFAAYLVVLGTARALATEPLLLLGPERAHERGRDAVGAMVALGAVGGAGCLLAGLVVGGGTGRVLAVLAAFLPLLLAQDAYRYVAFAAGLPARALVVDLAWLAGIAVAAIAFERAGAPGAAAFMAAWAGAGALAGLVGALRSGPPTAAGLRWVREHLHLGGPFTVEFVAAGGAAYAGLWLLGLVSGLAAVGAVRVGLTVFGPINVLYLGMYVVLVPEGARLAATEGPRLWRLMQRASALLVAAAAAWTVVALAVPAGVGEAFFGESWAQARPVLAPLGAAMGAGGVMAGAVAGLRARGAARRGLRVRLWTLPPTLLLPLAGAVVADEAGFATGFATASWLAAGLWWTALARELRAPAPADPGPVTLSHREG